MAPISTRRRSLPRFGQAAWPGVILLTMLLLGLPLAGCSQEATEEAATDSSAQQSGDGDYQFTRSNFDGIGKIYMGREISHVMGHLGASWLERESRVNEERTDLLLANLPINEGDNVADLGAGTGYFSLPMAEMVGDAGTVYAVDIQPEMLAIIEQRSAEQGITNITRVLATADDPKLPKNTINLALFVDAYHEFEWPKEVMKGVVDSLVSGGKVVLIEYRAEDKSVPIKRLHKMSETQARKEMTAAGLVFKENLKLLPQQHFMIFEKP